MGSLPGVPGGGEPGAGGRRPERAGPLHDQDEGTSRGEAAAASAYGGRVYTVISGIFYIGRGEQFDADQLEPYPPGAVVLLPGRTPHFHWARSGEYITQVSAVGPLGVEFVDPTDDKR